MKAPEFTVDVRLWKEMPESYWFLHPPADQSYRLTATSLQGAVDHATALVDFKPKYFQAMRVR